jgi:DHA1 family multidrug resistance protein-like MFS transporter
MLGGPRVLVATMFFSSFAWSFVFVSLPFHIQAISTLGPVATLRWQGWILGVSSLVTVLTAPVWGRLAGRADPKLYYVLVEVLQSVGFFGMAAARTLFELFVARFVLGFMGAASTFAFILAGRAPDPGEVRRQVAAVQSAMTVGQVIGPLGGAVAAARLGFRPSFVLGGLILIGCAALVRWGVTVPPDAGPARRQEGRPRGRDVLLAATIVLAGSTHLFFLTAVLPQILPGLGVGAPERVEVGGLVVFVSAAGAALGAILSPRLAGVTSERRLIALLLATSSALLGLLGAMGSVWTFTLVRFLQVACIAPVFPLVVANIAQRAGGGTIGLINSARIGAGFLGPLVATSVLASAPPAALYLLLAAVGVACSPLAIWSWSPAGARP